MELLTSESRLIGFEDPQKVSPDQISESHMPSTAKREIKGTNKLKFERSHQEQDEPISKTSRESANEYYLYRLFYEYHSALFEKHHSGHHKTTSSVNTNKDEVRLAEFIADLYINGKLESEEQQLLEYSINHRYLAEHIVQLSNLVDQPNENHIAEAIHDLIEGPEKETFKTLFTKVYKKAVPDTMQMSGK